MLLLTNDAGEKAIECDIFDETDRFKPDHLIVLTHQDGTSNWYVIGPVERYENKWIIPLQVVEAADEPAALRTGHIGHFITGRNGELVSS